MLMPRRRLPALRYGDADIVLRLRDERVCCQARHAYKAALLDAIRLQTPYGERSDATAHAATQRDARCAFHDIYRDAAF